MSFIFVSLQAERDLEAINDRISAYQSRQSATDFLNKIADKFELLANFPQMGRTRNELIPNLRSFPVEDYLIFYFSMPEGIEIARIVSGYRDLEALFGE